MTPGARFAAAIDILDRWLSGDRAERALTNWARANRYAGSKDRRAVRDLVYDVIRQKRSLAAWGGSETGRGLILGAVRQIGDPAQVFTGTHYDPPALTDAEAAWSAPVGLDDAVRLDWPDWLWPQINAALGDTCADVLAQMRLRAPVFLRVNTARATRAQAQDILLADDIETQPHPLAETALLVVTNPRRVAQSKAYTTGLVELQDAASQAVVQMAAPVKSESVLDYCAGGGGKTLALAAATGAPVVAHDANPARMRDLADRAARAGAQVKIAPHLGPPKADFDLVFCDVPCSGSGSWRRDPEGKWRLTPENLARLIKVQAQILAEATAYVRPDGRLVYVTCSMLPQENAKQVDAFCQEHPEWRVATSCQFTPLDGGDGFYGAVLTR